MVTHSWARNFRNIWWLEDFPAVVAAARRRAPLLWCAPRQARFDHLLCFCCFRFGFFSNSVPLAESKRRWQNYRNLSCCRKMGSLTEVRSIWIHIFLELFSLPVEFMSRKVFFAFPIGRHECNQGGTRGHQMRLFAVIEVAWHELTDNTLSDFRGVASTASEKTSNDLCMLLYGVKFKIFTFGQTIWECVAASFGESVP